MNVCRCFDDIFHNLTFFSCLYNSIYFYLSLIIFLVLQVPGTVEYMFTARAGSFSDPTADYTITTRNFFLKKKLQGKA